MGISPREWEAFSIIQKYTGVQLPEDKRHDGLRDPLSMLYGEAIKVAQGLVMIERDLQLRCSRRAELIEKIRNHIDADATTMVLPVNPSEAEDGLDVRLSEWRQAINYLQRLAGMYRLATTPKADLDDH